MISPVVTLSVGRRFFLTLCRCSIVVWIDFGKCFRIPFDINPGNDVNQFLAIALISVVTTGARNVAWCYAYRCDAGFCWYALLAVWLSWIINGLLIGFVLLLLLSSGINRHGAIRYFARPIFRLQISEKSLYSQQQDAWPISRVVTPWIDMLWMIGVSTSIRPVSQQLSAFFFIFGLCFAFI